MHKIPTKLKLTEGSLATFEAPVSTGAKRRFEMVAYTGAAMAAPLLGKVVIDLKGMNANGEKKPILRQHDPNRIAGYSDTIKKDGALVIGGTLSAKTDAGREVADLSDEGFPWQASVGIDIHEIQQIKAGDSVEVNGADFAGPGVIIRRSLLKESSFVPLGADEATSALVFADDGRFLDLPSLENNDMTLEQFQAFAAANPDATKPFIEQGYNQAKAELATKPATATEMKAAFPNNSGFAIDQLGLNATVDQAKAAFADVLAAEVVELKAQTVELSAKLAKATEGQGAINTAVVTKKTAPDASDPKALAEFEWDNDPSVRGGCSKDVYVHARMAELDGTHRSFSREPVTK